MNAELLYLYGWDKGGIRLSKGGIVVIKYGIKTHTNEPTRTL
jgi:hypothetical protein